MCRTLLWIKNLLFRASNYMKIAPSNICKWDNLWRNGHSSISAIVQFLHYQQLPILKYFCSIVFFSNPPSFHDAKIICQMTISHFKDIWKKDNFFPSPQTNCLYSSDFCGDRSGLGASEQSKHICLGRLLNYLAPIHLVPPREYFFSLTDFWCVWSTGFHFPCVSLRYSWWCGGTCDLRHLD